ncbi:MAG: hypothetical protein JNK04_11745 [Myxococcales bacterium]|nr:hypothetical protein [Myxococcales bacterium]
MKRLSADEADAIFARATAPSLEAISSTLPLGWVSMTHHMRLSCAIRDELGTARNIELWKRAMVHSFERPFLRGFVSMTTNLLGLRPPSLLRRGGSIYSHVTRNAGAMHWDERGDKKGEAVLTGFPADRYDFSCYLEGLAGCIDATLSICNTHGSVRVVERDDARGDVRYHVEWA